MFGKSFSNSMVAGLLLASAVWVAHAADPEKAVVQISTFAQIPVWDAPWKFEPVRRWSGTGFVVKKKRIMTNAHVVGWARQLLVRRYQDPRPYQAKVLFAGHDCDLALIEIDDDRFFQGLEPLELGGMPKVRSTVVTYGYPAGGEQISYTRGVVSRIEVNNYVHPSNRNLLAVQTDAAINPGNSGGPVIQEDKVVGVAFQANSGLENTGFFIPPPIIEHFLKDVEDGKYDGFPLAGVGMAALHNPAYRSFLGMPDDDFGARVDRVFPVRGVTPVLQPDDVLLRIGEFQVGSDATILFDGNRIHASFAFSRAQHGGKVPATVFRSGKPVELSVPVQVNPMDAAEGNQYDVQPRYYVYGGLVFTAMSRDYLRTFGANWSDAASGELVYELFYRRVESPNEARPEPVVLAQVLAHEVNANLDIRGRSLVDKVNGVRIERLDDLVRAFEQTSRQQDLIEFLPHGNIESLDRAEVKKAHAAILKNYGITKDRRL